MLLGATLRGPQTDLTVLRAPTGPVCHHPEHAGRGMGWGAGSYGRQRRYLDSQEGFPEEEVTLSVLIK